MSLAKSQAARATMVCLYISVYAAAVGSDPANPVTDTPPAGVFNLVVSASASGIASQAQAEVSVMNPIEGEDFRVLPRNFTRPDFRDSDA